MPDLDKLRTEAAELLEKTNNKALMMRSCWECNSAHGHLKKVPDFIIACFECKHYYFKGADITIGKAE